MRVGWLQAWRKLPLPVRDGLVAGFAGAAISGAPSTLHALLTGREPLTASTAAGTVLLPNEERTGRLLAAAIPVHLFVSLGWAVVLALSLPRRATAGCGALAGLAIAALDLGLIGRRYRRIRSLPALPQLADHILYGLVVGAVVDHRRKQVNDGPAALPE